MSIYRIEPAGFEHLGYLRLLFIRLCAEHPVDYPDVDNEEFDNFVLVTADHLRNNPYFRCYVAIVGKRVVGFLAGEITGRPIGKPHRVGRAHYLYVVPKHRGHGVARQLIAVGLDWLRSMDIDHVELAGVDDAWARRGFVPFLTHYMLPTTAIASRLGNGHDTTAPPTVEAINGKQ